MFGLIVELQELKTAKRSHQSKAHATSLSLTRCHGGRRSKHRPSTRALKEDPWFLHFLTRFKTSLRPLLS